MGSKRAMLGNGLGVLLETEVPSARRFVDLFTGSGAVATHIACRFDLPVLAFDLQNYSAILASAVIGRDATFAWEPAFDLWYKRAENFVRKVQVPKASVITKKTVAGYRAWCAAQHDLPVTKAYGGHYFSPKQSLWIDALRAKLPPKDPERKAALAALIQTASQTAAAPGHTAQPFQPTPTATRHLEDAWNREVVPRTKTSFAALANQYALQVGTAQVGDANIVATELLEGDLVFLDPPYSGVHYSRFYHVLETIAQGTCGEVSGVGRYPAREHRPRSSYSVSSESSTALDNLLMTLANRGARAILTFPDHECSNGLSGDSVREIASRHFRMQETFVRSKFSTLGGTGNVELSRSARRQAKELMLLLKPK